MFVCLSGVHKFVEFVKSTFPQLDILVNNAAQTIRRPTEFFRHLLDNECLPRDHLSQQQQTILCEQQVRAQQPSCFFVNIVNINTECVTTQFKFNNYLFREIYNFCLVKLMCSRNIVIYY